MESINLLELFAKIVLDTDDYESGLDSASGKTSSFADKLKKGLATAGKVAVASVTAITTASVALGTALVNQAGKVAEYGDNIDKMSQKMGLSAEAYQEWDAIMQHSGTSIESLQAGMKTLANAVDSGNDAFERLGITQEQIASMNNEELFSATISALQNVENETERTYLAGQLLGRGATELGALLNMSAEETEAMRQRVHELGGVLSDEAIKAAAAYQDSLQDMQTAFSGLTNSMTAEMLPALTTVMDGLTAIFAGESGGAELISQGIADLVGKITETIPQMLEVGGQIIEQLLGVIIDNLPMLVEAGAEVILSLATGIVKQLPQIVSSAAQILSTLIKSIVEALPEILSTGMDVLSELTSGIETGLPDMVARLPQIIDEFIAFISENLPTILEQGVEILSQLTFGIIEAIPALVAALPQIFTSITTFFVENFPLIVTKGGELLGQLIAGILGAIGEIAVNLPAVITAIVESLDAGWEALQGVGQNLMSGLWEGINSKLEWLKEKAMGVINTIKGWFTSVEGFDTHSPSKWSERIFRYVMEGGGEGLENGLPGVMRHVSHVGDVIKDGLAASATFPGISVADRQIQAISGVTGAMLAGGSSGGTYEIVVQVGESEMARVLFDPLRGVAAQRGESFA